MDLSILYIAGWPLGYWVAFEFHLNRTFRGREPFLDEGRGSLVWAECGRGVCEELGSWFSREAAFD